MLLTWDKVGRAEGSKAFLASKLCHLPALCHVLEVTQMTHVLIKPLTHPQLTPQLQPLTPLGPSPNIPD